MRNFELPGRSPVMSRNAMAATSHPLATHTALRLLAAGGNAMDAAIGACAVQCVVEPQSTGIGGDCFCLYAPQGSAELVAFNGSGRAPAEISVEKLSALGVTQIERQSPHSVTIPGAVDAWVQLNADHGNLSLADVLAPAIGYAREGYPIAPRVAFDFALETAVLRNDAESAKVFLPGGKPLVAGAIHHQQALADTLEQIGARGREAFYTGPMAEAIVEYLQRRGGFHTIEDFARARGEYVTPIHSPFRDYQVFECPPNGQGVIALLLLNLLADAPIGTDPLAVDRLHWEIEASRLAYRDRALWVADPLFGELPVVQMLSAEYARSQAALIDPKRAGESVPPSGLPAHHDTVYITVVDSQRNACSFINSLFHSFGSAQMAPGTGVMLHNRGQGFNLQPPHPNCVGAGKRPLHTIIPGMLVRNGQAVMPFGVMGGHYQAHGHMQLLTRMIDYGLDIQTAQDLPRLFPEPGGPVQLESGFNASLVDALESKGHAVAAPNKPIGGSQAIWIDSQTGLLVGGSDPRKDGCALGF